MPAKPREIERFDAMSEDGDRFTLIHGQYIIETVAQDGTRTRAPGIEFFTTADGDPVNRIDDDTFEIVRTAMIVKRIQS